MAEGIAITGLGVSTALGDSLSSLWESLLAGRSGIGPITGFDAAGFTCNQAAQVAVPSTESLGLSPRDARVLTLAPLILLQTGQAAGRQARMGETGLPAERIAFFAAMGLIDPHYTDLRSAVLKSLPGRTSSELWSLESTPSIDYHRFLGGAYQEIYPLWPLAMLNNVGFCLTAIQLGINGENAVFSTNADAGVMALAEAVESIRSGRADLALAGGAGEKVLPMSLARMQLLSELSPEGICRPLSPRRTGTVPGEGGGMVVLENTRQARDRGIVPLAKVSGWGFAGGPDPVIAQVQAMEKAMEKAGCRPEDIAVLLPHGDGTGIGDEAELAALALVFKTRRDPLPVFAVKAAIGHLLAGAALVDAVVASLILKNRTLPPLIDPPQENQRISWRVAGPGGSPLVGRRVLINARGWTGACASFILEGED